jgi:hypothetical protein
MTLVFLIYPAMNCFALAQAFRRPRSRLVSAVFYMNAVFAGLALLFGLGSACESIFSDLEMALTALLLWPPLGTSLGLWMLRGARWQGAPGPGGAVAATLRQPPVLSRE